MSILHDAVQLHLMRDSAMRPACVLGAIGDGLSNRAIDAAERKMIHVVSMPDPLACLSPIQRLVVLMKFAGQEYAESCELVRGVARGQVKVIMRKRVDTRDYAIARELGVSCECVRRLLREAEELVAGAETRRDRDHQRKCE